MATPLFDEAHLVSCAGLAPVMALAEQAGLSALLAERVKLGTRWVASAGVNPAGKVTSIIAGMAAGADCVDDLGVVGSGGMRQQFGGVYAPATLGSVLRAFTYGTQMVMALLPHVNRSGRVPSLPHEEGTRAWLLPEPDQSPAGRVVAGVTVGWFLAVVRVSRSR
jgi:hypothetical protein